MTYQLTAAQWRIRQSFVHKTTRDAKAATLKVKRDVSRGPGTPTELETPAQVRARVVKEYKAAHDGDEPDLKYVMKEIWKRTVMGREGASHTGRG